MLDPQCQVVETENFWKGDSSVTRGNLTNLKTPLNWNNQPWIIPVIRAFSVHYQVISIFRRCISCHLVKILLNIHQCQWVVIHIERAWTLISWIHTISVLAFFCDVSFSLLQMYGPIIQIMFSFSFVDFPFYCPLFMHPFCFPTCSYLLRQPSFISLMFNYRTSGKLPTHLSNSLFSMQNFSANGLYFTLQSQEMVDNQKTWERICMHSSALHMRRVLHDKDA